MEKYHGVYFGIASPAGDAALLDCDATIRAGSVGAIGNRAALPKVGVGGGSTAEVAQLIEGEVGFREPVTFAAALEGSEVAGCGGGESGGAGDGGGFKDLERVFEVLFGVDTRRRSLSMEVS